MVPCVACGYAKGNRIPALNRRLNKKIQISIYDSQAPQYRSNILIFTKVKLSFSPLCACIYHFSIHYGNYPYNVVYKLPQGLIWFLIRANSTVLLLQTMLHLFTDKIPEKRQNNFLDTATIYEFRIQSNILVCTIISEFLTILVFWFGAQWNS